MRTTLLLTLALCITISFLIYKIDKLEKKVPPINWDYAIDLKQDYIIIHSDYGKTDTIQYENITSFIENDNL